MRALNTLFILTLTILGTVLGAQAPSEPTTLFVGNDEAQTGTQGNPVNSISTKPYFSAVFDHDTPTETAVEARVQFATDSAFANIVGTSSWKPIAATATGNRIPDIQYTGSALDCVTQYYWRMKIRDSVGVAGPWSTEAASFNTVACPHEPTTLFVGNDEAQGGTQGDPVLNINTKPVFSALFTHDSGTATASEARVQFATDAAFANVVGSSAWKSVGAVTTGNRITDIEYNGSALGCNIRYWWRIKIKDNADVIGPWSTEVASFTTVNCPEEATTLFIGNSEAQTGTQGDPVNLINIQPYCSAIVTHSNPTEQIVDARVQFALDSAFANKLGTSSWKSITPTTAGNRSSDIRYNGQAVPGNTRVYWRIRYRDAAGVIGNWSTETASFETVPSPVEPTILFIDSTNAQSGAQGDPVTGVDLDPVFSAIFSHNDVSGVASRVRVQVASDSAFNNEVWNSGWQSIAATGDGARVSDTVMPGGFLVNSTTYYWRIRIEDTVGNKGPWSIEAASFTTSGGGGQPVPASVNISGLLQGETAQAIVTKTGGDPFPANVSVTFADSSIQVVSTTVTGADTVQIMIDTGNRAPHGIQTFDVVDGSTVLAQGSTLVFHPLQRQPDRINGTAQEALNSPMMLGAGVLALQGEFTYGTTDVTIPGRMLPLGFRRTYRSFLSYNGAMGQSWSSVIDASMRFTAATQQIEWLNSDGRISLLELGIGGQSGVGPYVEEGRYVEWVRNDNGTSGDDTDDSFVGTGPHGGQTTYAFGGLDYAGQPVYRLTSHQDRFGNRVDYVRDSIGQLTEIRGDLYQSTTPSRYRLTLEYGTDGRLNRIQDYADYTADESHVGSSHLGARSWDYFYNSAGDLIEVRGPATEQHGADAAGTSGRTRSLYAYQAETAQGHHLLTELYLPVQANLELSTTTGVPWLRNTYDASHRVEAQDIGASTKTDESHRRFIKYSASTRDEIDALGRRITVVLDSQGRALQVSQHTGTFQLDEFGAIQPDQPKLRSTDPDTYDTFYEYNLHGQLTRTVLPRGNEQRWLFDDQNASHRSRGNLLRAASLPGGIDTSALPAAQRNGFLVTYDYESTFNLPTEEVPSDAFDLSAIFDITQPIAGQVSRDDSQAYRTMFSYDTLGRLTLVTGATVTAAQSPNSPNVGQQFVREYLYNSFGQVTSCRDLSSYPAGYVGVDIDYEYGTSGFDLGYLTARITSPTGLNERVEFTYNSVGNLRTVNAVHGAIQTTIHDQLGRKIRNISPAIASLGGVQYTVEFTWDQNSNLVQRVLHDPELDAQGQPTAVIRDITGQWTYGVFGNLLASTGDVTDQTTRTVTHVYDSAYQLIEQHSPGGTKVVHTYDELGRPFQSFSGLTVAAATSQAIASSRVDYDMNSNLKSVTDPRQFQRTREYDAYDRLFTTDDARSPVATRATMIYAHGPSPMEVLITGDDGTATSVTLAHRREWRDNMGRTFRTANLAVAADRTTALGYEATETGTNDTPGWSVSTYTRLPDGRVTSMVGDLLDGADVSTSTQMWTMEYDGAGRATRTLDPVGNIRELIYTDARLSQELDHAIDSGTQVVQTSSITYGYDELSRVISKQACTQDPVLFRYDARNNVAHITDPRSGVMRFEYDHASRLTKQTRSATGLWSLSTSPTISTTNSADIESVFEYDLDDNTTRVIDNAGNQTTYAYDVAGRILQTHFANGGKATVGTSHTLTAIPNTAAYFETTGGYDANGNVLQMLDEGNNQLTQAYSPENEVLTMQIVKGQGSLIDGISGVSWQYDGLGRVLQTSTTQFDTETHTRTQAWNSMSLLESYTEQINTGTPRQYLRLHDESGRNYATQSPDATVTWIRDLLGRMTSYKVSRSGQMDIEGAWTYFGRGGLRSARAVSNDEDIEAQRDQRGRMVGVANVSRLSGGGERNPYRYLYDPQTGRREGMLNLDRPVVSGESRIGQPSDPNFGANRVFGTRTFFDGFGRITGQASEVTYFQGATTAANWDSHPDTHASANEFDRVDFPTETGIFLGQQFMNNPGAGHLTTPHITSYGDTANPLPQGDGSRFVPEASGDVDIEKTSDDELKIANDSSNGYIYDYMGRVIRTSRVSDDTVVDERKFDGTGIVYDHQINEYCVVDHDFAAPNLSGMTITTPNIRFDGGGLRFVGTTENELVQFSFPGDVRRNSQNTVQGGLTSYHDFLIDRDSGSSFLCNIYFVDYRLPSTRFRLEVGGTTIKLFHRPFAGQAETLLAQGSLSGTGSGPVAVGIQIESSLTSGPTVFNVFAGGSSRLSHSLSGPGNQWAPIIVGFEAGDETTRLYRYKGYLDFDFSQEDLRTVQYTPEQRVLQMLCGTNVPMGTNTPTMHQDNSVAYQMYKDQVLEFLDASTFGMFGAQADAEAATSKQSGNMGCGSETLGDMAQTLAVMEDLKAQAYAAQACADYFSALSADVNAIITDAESQSFGSPPPPDLGAWLLQNNKFLNGAPQISMDPVAVVREGDALVIPFTITLPSPQRVQISATGTGGGMLPAGLQVTLLTSPTQFGPFEYTGEITWTPPATAANQAFDVHIRVDVPAIAEINTRPFAEAVCKIEVTQAVIFAPAISISHSANSSGEQAFAFAHSQEEFHTTFAGQVYALWREDQPLQLDFAAHSDADTNFTWDATGLTGNWGITSNGSAAQVDWQPLLTPGIYELVVTAENSQGQASLTVWLRISPTSRAWNIRREHTSLYTAHWDGQTNTAPVWGANYGGAGYSYFPLDPTCHDCAGSMTRYIGNGDFIYTAGSTEFTNQGNFSNALISGPQSQLPDGLLTHAAISQIIQGWVQQARDTVEMLNDYIGAFNDMIQSQLAEMQRQSRMAEAYANARANMSWFEREAMDFAQENPELIKAGVFVGTAMLRTLMLPFEGAFMLGYAAGVYAGWDLYTKLGWLGFDTSDNTEWAEGQLGDMWEGLQDMGHSLFTAEGWSNWSDQMSLAYNADDPHDFGGAFESGIMFGDQVGGSALLLYGGAKGGKGGYRWVKGRSTPSVRSPLSSGGNVEVLPGGTGRAYTGHGHYRFGYGQTTVPEGTPLTIWEYSGRRAGLLPDDAGRAIEMGRYDLLNAADFQGSYTALPGSQVPNFRLQPPSNMTIMSRSSTVSRTTPLSDLLKPGMGHVEWAACTVTRR